MAGMIEPADLERMRHAAQDWKAHAKKLESDIAKLREALTFYANKYSWRSSSMYISGLQGPSAAEVDRGSRARLTWGLIEG